LYDEGSPFIRVRHVNRDKLKELKKSFNVCSYDAVLSFLLKNQGQKYPVVARGLQKNIRVDESLQVYTKKQIHAIYEWTLRQDIRSI